MKFVKTAAWAVAALALLATSCKKDDDNGGSSSSNTWTLNGTTYTATTVQRANSNNLTTLSAATTSGNQAGSSVGFIFASTPTASGKLRIGADNGVDIVATNASSTGGSGYTTINETSVDASVTVNSGKISITVPEVWLHSATGGSDSVKFSCTSITEP